MNSVRPASRSAFRLRAALAASGKSSSVDLALAQPSSVYSQVSGASAIWRLIVASSSGVLRTILILSLFIPCGLPGVGLSQVMVLVLEPLSVQTTWLQPVVDGDA